MAEKEYQRLTWSRMRRTGLLTAFATRSSLWLGKDHLLCIDSTGYGEDYKRFYFRDIQALTLVATNRRSVWNWVLGVLLFSCAAAWGIDLLTPQDLSLAGIITGSVVTLFFAVLLLINNLCGPSCACHLRTAVQTEVLPSLNRLRRARRVLDRIRPLIEEAQGRLSAEKLASKLANPAAPDTPPVIARRRAAPATVPPRYYSGITHQVLFWLLLVDVPLTAASAFYESIWMDVAGVVLLLVSVAYAIASVVKQHNTTLPSGLKRLPWLVLGWTGLMLVAAIAYGIVLGINNPEALGRSIAVLEDPVVLTMTLISTTGTAALGVVGLVLLRKFRTLSRAVALEPPVADSQPAV